MGLNNQAAAATSAIVTQDVLLRFRSDLPAGFTESAVRGVSGLPIRLSL
jgi:hypothetical protein